MSRSLHVSYLSYSPLLATRETYKSLPVKRKTGGAVGIEIASLTSKSFRGNGVAPPPHSNWSLFEPSQDKARSALESLRALGIDTKKMFGTKSEVDPISHLIGTAVVWGGSPPSAAVYEGITPTLNDGKTALEAHSEGRAS